MSTRLSSRHRSHQPRTPGFFGLLLDPIDRLSQIIYSVLILLTFTLAFRVFNLGGDPGQPVPEEYATDLLFAALGALFAWGLIDGLMYILMEVFQRGGRHRLLKQIQEAASEEEALAVIADELDYVLEPIAGEARRQALYRNALAQLSSSTPRPIGLKREDITGALGCVVVSMLAVLPSLLPFVLLRHDYGLAIRVSNVISFLVLFAAGYRWGAYTGTNPWRAGLLLVGVGILMVAIAIPLGG